jgi:Flp pilus assembly pilin Flp
VEYSSTNAENGGIFQMKNLMKRLWQDEQGQDLTEYALLLVLLSLAAVASLDNLAGAINNVFSNGVTALSGATT